MGKVHAAEYGEHTALVENLSIEAFQHFGKKCFIGFHNLCQKSKLSSKQI